MSDETFFENYLYWLLPVFANIMLYFIHKSNNYTTNPMFVYIKLFSKTSKISPRNQLFHRIGLHFRHFHSKACETKGNFRLSFVNMQVHWNLIEITFTAKKTGCFAFSSRNSPSGIFC